MNAHRCNLQPRVHHLRRGELASGNCLKAWKESHVTWTLNISHLDIIEAIFAVIDVPEHLDVQ